jgi:protein SCO1/2
VLPVVVVMAFAIFQPIQVLPRISLAPAYSLIDQDGEQVTSEDLRGHVVLYTFAHSNCVSPCVPTSATLASMQPALSELDLEGIPLRFVTIYVDPDQATPAKLHALAEGMDVDSEKWRFVSGDAVQLKNVVGAGFRTYYDQDDQGNFMVDPVFVLLCWWMAGALCAQPTELPPLMSICSNAICG